MRTPKIDHIEFYKQYKNLKQEIMQAKDAYRYLIIKIMSEQDAEEIENLSTQIKQMNKLAKVNIFKLLAKKFNTTEKYAALMPTLIENKAKSKYMKQ